MEIYPTPESVIYFDSFLINQCNEYRYKGEYIRLNYDAPNPYLDKFDGELKVGGEGPYKKSIKLNKNNLLLRGTKVKNVDYVIGVCVYTGHHTKIMLNSSKSRSKHSKLERKMNK